MKHPKVEEEEEKIKFKDNNPKNIKNSKNRKKSFKPLCSLCRIKVRSDDSPLTNPIQNMKTPNPHKALNKRILRYNSISYPSTSKSPPTSTTKRKPQTPGKFTKISRLSKISKISKFTKISKFHSNSGIWKLQKKGRNFNSKTKRKRTSQGHNISINIESPMYIKEYTDKRIFGKKSLMVKVSTSGFGYSSV